MEYDVDAIASWITTAVTVASIIAAVTPTPKDDGLVRTLYKIIDAVAINLGRAKEK